MRLPVLVVAFVSGLLLSATAFAQQPKQLYTKILDVEPKPIATAGIRYDYDIVYVRARRAGDKVHKRFFTDFSQPVTMEPGADLMLLHPDGKEERLVEGARAPSLIRSCRSTDSGSITCCSTTWTNGTSGLHPRKGLTSTRSIWPRGRSSA